MLNAAENDSCGKDKLIMQEKYRAVGNPDTNQSISFERGRDISPIHMKETKR